MVYILNWEIIGKKDGKEKAIQKQLFVTLTEDEQKIYDYLLEKNNESIDNISLDCEIPVFKSSSILLNMELKGVIRPLPGKIFEIL